MRNQVAAAAPMRQIKGFTGNRYSTAQKREVTRFVKEYDTRHGRGGIAAAQREFKVSYISLRNWLTGNKDPKRRRGEGFAPVIDRLLSIKGQMRDLEKELRRLRRKV